MTFPQLSDIWRLQRLIPPTEPVDIVLDTDTYNEVDDQFAVVYALLSPEKIRLQAPVSYTHLTLPTNREV